MKMRIERDSMGEMPVPEDALYGAQTARAVQNFQITGDDIGREMIRALGQIKTAGARVNRDLGLLDKAVAEAIIQAAQEVTAGILDHLCYLSGRFRKNHCPGTQMINAIFRNDIGACLYKSRVDNPG